MSIPAANGFVPRRSSAAVSGECAWARLAYYLLALNRLDEAEQALRTAIEVPPAAPTFHYVLTMIEHLLPVL